MTDYQELKRLAERAKALDHNENQGWYTEQYIQANGAYYPKNAAYIAAASPDVVLGLIKSIEHTTMAANSEANEVDERNAVIDRLRTQNQALVEALKYLLLCPYEIDSATISNLGLEETMNAMPYQVVGNMSVALIRIRKARAALTQAEGGV